MCPPPHPPPSLLCHYMCSHTAPHPSLSTHAARYGLAYGSVDSGNPFMASPYGFAMKDWSEVKGPSGAYGRWSDWFFQWAFAATATTIPAGCVAERFNFNAYLGKSRVSS